MCVINASSLPIHSGRCGAFRRIAFTLKNIGGITECRKCLRQRGIMPKRLSVMVFLLLAACGQQPTGDAGPPSSLDQQSSAAGKDKYPDRLYDEPGMDGDFARAARNDPGFGGMFVDPSGRLHVFVTRANNKNANKITVSRYLRDLKQSQQVFGAEANALQTDESSIVYIKAKYDWRDLLDKRIQIRESMLGDGVISLDIDETTQKIRLGYDKPESVGRIEQRLKALDVPRDMYELFQDQPGQVQQTAIGMSTDADASFYNYPLVGGLKIETSGECTLGVNAYLNNVYGFITNFHCVPTPGAVGTNVYQSDQFGRLIGTETRDPAVFTCGTAKCRYSDVAFIQYGTAYNPSATTTRFGGIARPTTLYTSAPAQNNFQLTDQFFNIVGVLSQAAPVNSTLYKVGQNTGWTKHVVNFTCADAPMNDGYTRICSSGMTQISIGGDSGAPVFQIVSGNNVNFAGLLFGQYSGSTVFSPVHNFVRDFPTATYGSFRFY